MGQFIRKVIVYCLLSTLVYLGIIFLLSNSPEDFKYYVRRYTNVPLGLGDQGSTSLLRFRDIYNYKDLDILFVGSSHCYRSFDTRVFARKGLAAFNMGSTSQTPLNSYFLLERYLDFIKPKLVVLEVNPMMTSVDGSESFLDLLANMDFNFHLLKMAFATHNFISINGILMHFFELKRISNSRAQASFQQDDIYNPGGFVETTRSRMERYVSEERSLQIRPVQIEYIKKIVRLVRQNGGRLLLVTAPMYEGYMNDLKNYPEWKSAIVKLSRRIGAPYLDFTGIPELSRPSLYYDFHHLNAEGVKRFNNLFLKALARHNMQLAGTPSPAAVDGSTLH